jgi:two-component system sensor histidine kinase SenX3
MDASLAAAVGAIVGASAAGLLAGATTRRQAVGLAREAEGLRSDLARQRRASDETRELQDLILTSMQDGVLLLDPKGRTAFTNAALERHLGVRPTSAAHLFPAALRGLAAETADGGTNGSVLIEVDEPPRSLRVIAAPAGTDGSVLMVVRDVTEARRIDSIRRDFVSNASHELKTPAASIQAAAETLRHAAADDPEAVPRFVVQLEREALRLSRIVADLLDLSRLETGSDLSDRVFLDALVREEAQRWEQDAVAAGVSVSIGTPVAAQVRGSPRDLVLMIRNLVDNAIRYTRPGGSVAIDVSGDASSVVLTIRDTGIGIPTKDLTRIFERFYRVDRARSRETGGTGLGLSIVRHVAENHGGTVEVRSELGRGTTFEVRLPGTASPRPVSPPAAS